MKAGRFLLLLAGCLMLQRMASELWQGTVYTDLVLLLVFLVGRISSDRAAVTYGWLAGLCQDLGFPSTYPMGVHAISKMTVGYISHYLTKGLNMDHPGLQSLMIFFLTFLDQGILAGLFVIFGQTNPVHGWLPILFGAAFNALLNFPIWWLSTRRRSLRKGAAT